METITKGPHQQSSIPILSEVIHLSLPGISQSNCYTAYPPGTSELQMLTEQAGQEAGLSGKSL